ncbi:glycosyltransferase family 4 protein [Phocaeicola plebeius]|uniref:glycosyltransferase family 4 protein n=1 Tax=Phocaeicola plebeius TaxID=310297 RepID=UPI0026EFF99F|nr:glycosyltransferase [Phocaeicola plebeius]
MVKKNLTLLFNHFEESYFGKDVFLVPYYIGKIYNYSVTIVFPKLSDNILLPNEYRGVKLTPIDYVGNSNDSVAKDLALFKYLLKNAKKIDFLMRFHNSLITAIMISLYKILNKKGFTYVKLDIDPLFITEQMGKNKFKSLCIHYIYKYYTQVVDLVSCETTQSYQKLQNSKSILYRFGNKLRLMPNGFDEDKLEQIGTNVRNYQQKENLIITVGRLGTEEKNTSLLLEALENIELHNWKVILIGPIQESFQSKIQQFYKRNPHKKNAVLFTGAIYNKKDLWEYYNRAKVFVLTSKRESYGLVLNEAKRFKNYILTPNVGAASDILENNHYGNLISNKESGDLSNRLNNIILGKTNINVYSNFDPFGLSWENMIHSLHIHN